MGRSAEPEFLTLTEAADAFNISRVTLWRAARAGRLETFQSGRDRRATLVRREDVEAFVAPQPVIRTIENATGPRSDSVGQPGEHQGGQQER